LDCPNGLGKIEVEARERPFTIQGERSVKSVVKIKT